MARSRRRTSRRRRPRADWVFRGSGHGGNLTGGLLDDNLASYTPVVTSINVGSANARALILYDSQNTLTHPHSDATTGAMTFLPGAARAEGRNPTILAVVGQLYIEPSTWAAGQIQAYGIRIGAFEQDPQTGLLSLDPDYSMWNILAAPVVSAQASTWANWKNWDYEHRTFRVFTTSNGNGGFQIPIRFRCRRRLKPWQCYAVYMEGENTSVNARIQPWFRTLVSDEG